MIEPYVDEEVSWAVRVHQALRFFPDELVGYKYPDMYVKNFGPDYKPEPYIVEEYKRAREHKWYMTARQICVNDIYSFDPNAKVEHRRFRRHRRPQLPPARGRARLGFEPVGAHVAHADAADAVFAESSACRAGMTQQRQKRPVERSTGLFLSVVAAIRCGPGTG